MRWRVLVSNNGKTHTKDAAVACATAGSTAGRTVRAGNDHLLQKVLVGKEGEGGLGTRESLGTTAEISPSRITQRLNKNRMNAVPIKEKKLRVTIWTAAKNR